MSIESRFLALKELREDVKARGELFDMTDQHRRRAIDWAYNQAARSLIAGVYCDYDQWLRDHPEEISNS